MSRQGLRAEETRTHAYEGHADVATAVESADGEKPAAF